MLALLHAIDQSKSHIDIIEFYAIFDEGVVRLVILTTSIMLDTKLHHPLENRSGSTRLPILHTGKYQAVIGLDRRPDALGLQIAEQIQRLPQVERR